MAEQSALEFMIGNSALHFGGGFAFSVMDYVKFTLGQNKDERTEQKKGIVRSMDTILTRFNGEIPPAVVVDDKNSNQTLPQGKPLTQDYQFAENVAFVKQYLLEHGLLKKDVSNGRRVLYHIKNFFKEETINSSSSKARWGWAAGVEVFYDSLLGFGHYSNIVGQSPVAAFSYNIWQIPAFWLGLTTGKYATKGFHNLFARTSEERAVDKAIQGSLRNTKILDIVANYEPSEQLKKELKEGGVAQYRTAFTNAGKSIIKVAGSVYSSTIGAISDRQQQKKIADKKIADERKNKFYEMIKKH